MEKKEAVAAVVFHGLGEEVITVGASIRKVVVNAGAIHSLHGGFNSAACWMQFVCAPIPPWAEDAGNELVRSDMATVVPALLQREPVMLIFDTDMGLSPAKPEAASKKSASNNRETAIHKSQNDAAAVWSEPICSEEFVFSPVLVQCARSMVESEISAFILKTEPQKVILIRCMQHYGRRRLRLPHASQLVRDWPSYSKDLDELQYAELCDDISVMDDYSSHAFLFTHIGGLCDSRYAQPLSICRVSCIIDGHFLDELITIGIGQLNPYIEQALMHMSPNVNSFLVLPSIPHHFDFVDYLRPAVFMPGLDLTKPEEIALSARSWRGNMPKCPEPAFGVICASSQATSVARLKTDCIIRAFRVHAVHILPDITSPVYDAPKSADEREQLISDDDQSEDSVENLVSSLRLERLRYQRALGCALSRATCHFDALRIFMYGKTELLSLLSNKTYATKGGDYISQLLYAFNRNIVISLLKLKEYRHALHAAEDQILSKAPDDVSLLLLAARCELGLDRPYAAEAHLRRALTVCVNSEERKLITHYLKVAQRSRPKLAFDISCASVELSCEEFLRAAQVITEVSDTDSAPGDTENRPSRSG